MLRILEDDGRGSTPVATDILTRLPLGQGSHAPLPCGLGGILLEDAIAPGAAEPAGKRSGLQVIEPAVREVRLDLDQLLVHQTLPVRSHLEGLRSIDADLPGLATDAKQVPTILPDIPDELAWLSGVKVADVDVRVGGMQFSGVVGVLRPGSGEREIILLEDVLPVEEGHLTTILRDGVDPIGEFDLIPHPGRKLILHRVRPVLGTVNDRPARLAFCQGLELDLSHYCLSIAF